MLILDLLLFFIIGVCITYCWLLNRRIQQLQDSRLEFTAMIKQLNMSMIKAESNLSQLKQLSTEVSNELTSSINLAATVSSELTTLSSDAKKISNAAAAKMQFDLAQPGELAVPPAASAPHNNYNNSAVSDDGSRQKTSQHFADEDFIDDQSSEIKANYPNHLKEFLTQMSKKSENNQSLDQVSYYDTLRKVNTKK